MSRDKAKDLIGKMKPKVLKLCDRYERSGLGWGQWSPDDDKFGHFNLENCIEGDDICNFLGHESSDVLYWWKVLYDEELLNFTLAILPEIVAAKSDKAPISTVGGNKKKRKADQQAKVEEFHSALQQNSETIGKGIVLSAFDSMQSKIESLESKCFELELKLLEDDGRMSIAVKEHIQNEIDQLNENIAQQKKRLEN